MNFISGIKATSSALNAEQIRMDVVAQNIANAQTTKDLDGNPYQRKIVTFESVMLGGPGSNEKGVKITEVKSDESDGDIVFNPGHPHADREGMVRMPNVKIATEMVDLMSASRAYEANLSVVRNARQMAMKALSIARS
jgi:flagellar basal-body rod protein FlgC